MKHTPKLALAALLSGTFLSGAALAAGTHPDTGEALADDQTFTYRVLDELSSLDPQIVDKLAEVIDEAVNDPSYVEFLATKGEVPNVVKGQALADRLQSEYDALAEVSAQLGL